MSKPTPHTSVPDQDASIKASTSEMPGWLILLGVFVLMLVIVVLVAPSCQGPQRQQLEQQPEVEEGVKTVDEALAAGGVSSNGDSNVTTAFAAYSWDELKDIAQEIAASGSTEAAQTVAQKYHLVDDHGRLTGDSKPFTWEDGTDGAVQIAGFYHDDKAGGGKAGITFITRDCLPEKQYMNASGTNDGGWEASDVRVALEDVAKEQLPSELRGKAVAVKKATNNVGVTDDVASVTQTSDTYWLYSKTELGGVIASNTTYDEVLNAEGYQYQLFSDNAVVDRTPNSLLVKQNEGSDSVWWTRTPMPHVDAAGSGYYVVLKTGASDDFSYYADTNYGVVLGFCF